MTHHCCHDCRLHFAAGAVPDLEDACPECGRPLAGAPASQVIGYRRHDGTATGMRAAVAAALALPAPPPRHS